MTRYAATDAATAAYGFVVTTSRNSIGVVGMSGTSKSGMSKSGSSRVTSLASAGSGWIAATPPTRTKSASEPRATLRESRH